MRYRKLRIAWSVVFGILCLLLIALWVRSYWWVDVVKVKPPELELTAWSISGKFGFENLLQATRNDWDLLNPWELTSEKADVTDYSPSISLNWQPQYSRLNIVYFHEEGTFEGYLSGIQPYRRTLLMVPQYYPVALAALLAGIPWIRWRFGLRTLLITTTLVAVVLGLIVYAGR
jgi:hypothetical protein